MSFYTTVQWLSALEVSKLKDPTYLLNANVDIREELDVRYDRIKLEESDMYDPFSLKSGSWIQNSYLIDPRVTYDNVKHGK